METVLRIQRWGLGVEFKIRNCAYQGGLPHNLSQSLAKLTRTTQPNVGVLQYPVFNPRLG